MSQHGDRAERVETMEVERMILTTLVPPPACRQSRRNSAHRLSGGQRSSANSQSEADAGREASPAQHDQSCDAMKLRLIGSRRRAKNSHEPQDREAGIECRP